MTNNYQFDGTNEAAILQKELESFDRVLIDTCSIIKIEDESLKFWYWATQAIHGMRGTSHEKRILLPKAVYLELSKHSETAKPKPGQADEDFSKLKQNSANAISMLAKLKAEGVIDIIGDQNDPSFADSVFTGIIERFKTIYSILVITNDRGLATTIRGLSTPNAAVSHGIKTIQVMRITNHGTLGRQDGLDHTIDGASSQTSSSNTSHNPNKLPGAFSKKASSTVVPDSEKFKPATKIATADSQLQVTTIPKEGDTISAERNGEIKNVTLGDELASGGEGSIYAIANNELLVAKIYKLGKITSEKEAKLKLIISKHIACDGICFPVAILRNSQQQFVGYLMPIAKGKELGKTIFIPPKFRKDHPDWTRKDTVQLCITILEKMKYLHDRNIVLGDINPANILFVSPKEVYFVDTDSYQIEGYICPVGTVNFTPPEILGKDFKTFIRSLETDRYSIAVLLFEIMLPGRHPYTTTGEQRLEDNSKKGYFPYPFLDNSGKSIPDGQWRYIWSHLPVGKAGAPEIKGMFYQTFEQGEKFNAPHARLSADRWLDLFLRYKDYLTDPKTKRFDEQQLSIFPTRLKRPNEAHELCPSCKNNWYDATQFTECYECSQSNLSTCMHCGKKFKPPINRPNTQYCFDHKEMGWTPRPVYPKATSTQVTPPRAKPHVAQVPHARQYPTRPTAKSSQPVGSSQPSSQQKTAKDRKWWGWLAAAAIALIVVIGSYSAYQNSLTPQAKLNIPESELQTLPGTVLYYSWDEDSDLGGWNYEIYSKDVNYYNITIYLDISESNLPSAEIVGTTTATLSYYAGSVSTVHFDLPEDLIPDKDYWGAIVRVER